MLKKIGIYFTSVILATTLIGSAYAVTLKASHQWPEHKEPMVLMIHVTKWFK